MNQRTSNFFHSAAVYALMGTCLSLALATPLLSLFSILTLVFWLLSGRIKALPVILKENVFVLLGTLLFVLFMLGMTYSSADLSEALDYLKKYRELLFIPVAVSLLRNDPAAKAKCEICFLAGCIILMLISYCMFFSILPEAKYGNSILFHITHNFFMSLLAFYAAHKSLDSANRSRRILWLSVFLLCFFNMFYIAPGRTGMLIFFFLMMLFLVQRLSLAKQLAGLMAFSLVISAAFITSDNFRARVHLALEDIQTYEYGSSRSSLGMRFDWWVNSLQIIKEKPIIGHGTGSFPLEHDRYILGTKMMKTDNPHNEYLLVGTQLGAVGLAVFLSLFMVQLLFSFKLQKPDRLYVQGILVAMATGCTANSFLFDSHQGHFWAIMSAVYLASLPECSIAYTRDRTLPESEPAKEKPAMRKHSIAQNPVSGLRDQ